MTGVQTCALPICFPVTIRGVQGLVLGVGRCGWVVAVGGYAVVVGNGEAVYVVFGFA